MKKETSESLYNSQFINVDGNEIHKTAIINDNVIMGKGNRIGAYTVIGSNGEIRGKDQSEFKGKIIIGDDNVISEHVTIQTPYEEGTETRIGSRNILMAHVHIGHDALIGDDCEICTTTIIAGYTVVKDKAKIKLGCVTRNRITIGEGAIVGMGSVVTKNVRPGDIVYGNPAKSTAE